MEENGEKKKNPQESEGETVPSPPAESGAPSPAKPFRAAKEAPVRETPNTFFDSSKAFLEGLRDNFTEACAAWYETKERILAEFQARQHPRRAFSASRVRLSPARPNRPVGGVVQAKGSAGWLAESLEAQEAAIIRPILGKEVTARYKDILIVGGMDFLGAAMVEQLNTGGFQDIVVSDLLTEGVRDRLPGLKFQEFLTHEEFLAMAASRHWGRRSFSHVFYLGGWDEGDLASAKSLLVGCLEAGGRFIAVSPASSMGSCGPADRDVPEKFRPQTCEGMVSCLFDRYLFQKASNRGFLSLKYYQLYGPGRLPADSLSGVMNSCFEQIGENGQARLPSALHPEAPEGRRQFDFFPIEEAAKRAIFLGQNRLAEGIYELGSGTAQTPMAFCAATAAAAGRELSVTWVDELGYVPPAEEPDCAALGRIEKAGWHKSAGLPDGGKPRMESRTEPCDGSEAAEKSGEKESNPLPSAPIRKKPWGVKS